MILFFTFSPLRKSFWFLEFGLEHVFACLNSIITVDKYLFISEQIPPISIKTPEHLEVDLSIIIIEKWLRHKFFHVNFAKFFRASYFSNTSKNTFWHLPVIVVPLSINDFEPVYPQRLSGFKSAS